MQNGRVDAAELLVRVACRLNSSTAGRTGGREGVRTHLLEEWLLTYRVQVPDSASKVSTPNEHRICSKVPGLTLLTLSYSA